MKQVRGLFALAMIALLGYGVYGSELIIGLNTAGELVRFNSANPTVIESRAPITGLAAGETLVGMDFRPATGQLYGISSNSIVYVINPATGAATAKGAAFTPVLNGTSFGVDFNPTVDRIRVVSDAGQNIRLNPNTGAIAATDTLFVYGAGDANAGATPRLVASAYTNNFSGSSATTLYEIDATQDVLVTQGSLTGIPSPNGNGTNTTIFTVGKLGVNTGDQASFDISSSSGTAFAALTLNDETTTKLFTLNLFTGSATLVGAIGSESIRAIAIVPPPTTFDVVALRNSGNPVASNITRFDRRTPNVSTVVIPVTGLSVGEILLGIDYRPANGLLYGLGNTSRIYTIDPITGVATAVGAAFTPVITGTDFGFDFNPAADRIRIVSNADENFRVNPDTGAAVVATPPDAALQYAAADANVLANPNVVASAYTNNIAGATSTTLYGIDSNLDILATQVPPNSGTLNTIAAITTGGAPLNISANATFDIASDGAAFFADGSQFYTLNLTTGVATLIGAIGAGTVNGITLVPAINLPTLAFSAPTFGPTVEASLVGNILTINRTGSTQGTVSVDFTTSSGTATAGSDFTTTTGTLIFLDGEASRTISIPTLSDTTQELFETFTVTLSNPVGATLGAQSTATVTIADFDDRDGDGFRNEDEIAATTNPDDAASTPFSGQPAGTALPLNVKKFSIKLNFTTKTMSDSISISGELDATVQDGLAVVNIGGIAKMFTLVKGKAKSADKKDSMSLGKPKLGKAKYTVSLKKGDFHAAPPAPSLTDEGLDDTQNIKDKPVKVAVAIFFDNKTSKKVVDLLYASVPLKKGSTKLPKP